MTGLGRIGAPRGALAAVAASLLFSAAAWSVPDFDVAYGGEGMHIALDGIQGAVFLVVAAVAWGRYARGRLVSDLLVAVGFAVMAVESAFLLALPTLLNFELLRPFSVWSSTLTLLVATTVLLAGSLAGTATVRRRAVSSSILLVVGLVVGVGLLFARRYDARLPLAIDPSLSPVAPNRRLFTGNEAILISQGVAAALLLAAGIASAVRSKPTDRSLPGWLGPALVVDGIASLNYAAFPTIYSYWVYTGDILRLAFCALLTWGVAGELRSAARRAIDVAVLEERRRLARDLHDGVAQELAYVAAELSDLPADLHPSIAPISSAIERGLFESRRAIAALTLPLDGPVAAAIANEAEELTSRSGTAVRLELDPDVNVSRAAHEAMLRVVREAVTNAVRHGHADTVRVRLAEDDAGVTVLEIDDDGDGFAPDQVRYGGFGLTSMRERVASTGGRLDLESSTGAGTRVVARWTRRRRTHGGAVEPDLTTRFA